MLLDMVERMLRHVRDTRTLLLRDRALRWLQFAEKALDHRRLTGTVRADNGDTRKHGHLDTDAVKRRLLLGRVLELDVSHLQQGLALGLDALEVARLRELELRLRRLDLEVV